MYTKPCRVNSANQIRWYTVNYSFQKHRFNEDFGSFWNAKDSKDSRFGINACAGGESNRFQWFRYQGDCTSLVLHFTMGPTKHIHTEKVPEKVQ